jgi:hypothetical protein
MSNFLRRKLCLQGRALFIAGFYLTNSAYPQESGGIYSLGISDDAKVRFAWRANAEPDLAGYRVYVGTTPGIYSGFVDVGLVTSFELTDLLRGMSYYFALTAYNTAGLESDFTPELTRQIPLLDSALSAANQSAQAITNTNDVPVISEPLPDSPPAISPLPDLFLAKNRPTEPIQFTVSDAETPAADLQVVAFSSNPLVLTPSGMTLAGSDANRTLVVDPLNGQTGVSTVTVAVTDGLSVTTASFQVTVDRGEITTYIPPLVD